MSDKCDLNEIRIRGVNPKLYTELVNISKNVGTSVSALLKPKIAEFVNSYPPEMKLPLRED